MTSRSADDARRERRVRLDRRKRRCNACARGFAALLVLLTLFGSFFPFEWNPPLWLGNGAQREGSAIRFTGPGLVEVSLGDRFAGPLARRESFEIELEFRAESLAENACLLGLVAEPNRHDRLTVRARRTSLELGFAEGRRFNRDLEVDEALAVGTTTWCRVVLNPILDRWPWPDPVDPTA